MTTTAAQNKPAERLKVAAKTTGGRFVKQSPTVSWELFQKKYRHREDGFKYEWADGVVEKSKRTMDKTQFHIIDNLLVFFHRLLFEGKTDGQLITEGDIFFLENHRIPDLAWYSKKQLSMTAKGENQVPSFVIEVISTHDGLNRMMKKMGNYRAAGVKTVWHIFPELEEVHVFSGENLDKMTVCRGETICSAAPALPLFQLSAADVFKKPIVH